MKEWFSHVICLTKVSLVILHFKWDLLFIHYWDYCWKWESDTDVKIETFYHHDGEQLGLYKKYIHQNSIPHTGKVEPETVWGSGTHKWDLGSGTSIWLSRTCDPRHLKWDAGLKIPNFSSGNRDPESLKWGIN